ncbi:MFS transporter [Phytohabitans sp. ZYX-F-186]|uniref:MFS transporter n=1 Tax=Phytohabitans maris TaxID=3071409 RepID=A0ABU0ZG66_9ACTN|nr:MFS transporter [Phytohabitans sp. ZYX-F-186]MDQ7906056.1 MFS transporter [Phytohabitans sp. ZYX-F-186]
MSLPDQVEATGPALDAPVAHPSALRVTLTSPLYRGATIAVFLGAVGFSAAAPQIASFLVNDLGASLRAAGLFYLTSLTAPVAGYVVGRRSDRTGRRLGLFRLCAVLGFVGWIGIAYSTQLWMPYLISAVIGAFGGAATSQLFAAIHDQLKAHPNPNNDGVVAVVRMALTGGWVIGPVAGAFLAAHTSPRTMLVATAFCTLAQIIPLGTRRSAPGEVSTPQSPKPRPDAPTTTAMLPLLAFTGLFATSGTAAGLFIGQVLMGAVWGVFAALGIIVAQRLLPTAVATASAIFISSTALASALGGAAGGLAAAAIGLPLVFLIPAAAGLLATIGLALMVRTDSASAAGH